MSHYLFHNNTASLNDLWYESHASILKMVAMDCGCADKIPELLEKYLAGELLLPEEIKIAIRKATLDGTMIPTLCGSAFRNKGVQRTLDAVIDYLPSPLDVGSVTGFDVDDNSSEIERNPDDKDHFSALAFKIMTDP